MNAVQYMTARGRNGNDWPTQFARKLFWTDIGCVSATLLIFGLLSQTEIRGGMGWENGPEVAYWLVLTAFSGLWLLTLDIVDTRDDHVVGHGIAEYQRILRAGVSVVVVTAAAAFFLGFDVSRTLLLVAVPAGTALLLASRWVWRKWLHHRQRAGLYQHRAVALGERANVAHVARTMHRASGIGYDIVGAITQRGTQTPINGDIPVLGTYGETSQLLDDVSADTVIFAGADDIDPRSMRALGWSLSDRRINLVVAPALTDIAGPRIHARPVAGLPLIHIDYPRMEGARRVAKRAFDLAASALILLAASPLMFAIAICIKLDSPGPVLYRQERVGRGGRPFAMMKFRSMSANADDQLASLLDAQGDRSKPLFKVQNDPRVTSVGRFLRKYSLDEFPQLLNVLRGEMSLVGPRPQREAEVALYDDAAHRRLLVKPGMSGLWQVSGRSALSWDDALRLDLYYVENWSFTQDMQILFRTFKAVLAPGNTAH